MRAGARGREGSPFLPQSSLDVPGTTHRGETVVESEVPVPIAMEMDGGLDGSGVPKLTVSRVSCGVVSHVIVLSWDTRRELGQLIIGTEASSLPHPPHGRRRLYKRSYMTLGAI